MMPPSKCLSADTISNVVAVPLSMIINGPSYRKTAPNVVTRRSAPTCSGLSTRTPMPTSTPASSGPPFRGVGETRPHIHLPSASNLLRSATEIASRSFRREWRTGYSYYRYLLRVAFTCFQNSMRVQKRHRLRGRRVSCHPEARRATPRFQVSFGLGPKRFHGANAR